MKAIIKMFGAKEPLLTKETYGTIKRRMYSSELFLEVTDADSKLLINKSGIELIGQEEVKKAGKKKKA